MGSSCSLSLSRHRSLPAPLSLPAVAQIHSTIQEMWSELRDTNHYEQIGVQFMICLLITHPELKRLWIFCAQLETVDEMRSNSQLCYHAKKITNTLNDLIIHIDNPEKRKQILESLGKTHYQYDVKPVHFEFAKIAMDSALTEVLRSDFTLKRKQAWSFFFQQIVVDLRYGVNQQEMLL
ncbi:unnamed protein product [Didymodactylos carnosus]|uniref:Globin domain-containing protein n=1 Tax=Didymodactylos carnosus TaxID=1234261 RepID=A0A814F4J4_9BILA|nr:unnamed protein product [Didymodactylos carnosus]CAF1226994.1 unnamed protein product [Didymodactylos carnosus]CAF3750799.1 unnamed protein product [Didymodactylos carnosus]CAF4035077.1 unnamed protein product [Didymodactylos carnosus]